MSRLRETFLYIKIIKEQNKNDKVQNVQEPLKNNKEKGTLALASSNAAGQVEQI